jgi:hypothetical protein
MYNLIFYNFYLYVKFCKRVFNSNLYRDLKFGSILIISFHEFINIATIMKYLGFQLLNTKLSFTLNFLLSFLPIVLINYWIFGIGNKFEIVLSKLQNESYEILQLSKIITIIYSIITFISIFVV